MKNLKNQETLMRIVTMAPLVLVLVASQACAGTDLKAGKGLRLENGWFVQNGRVIWGYGQLNAWWTPREGANITRRDPGHIGPNLTENLDKLTDNMLRYGYPGFEHNYGLWYDRRRDVHDTVRRTNSNALPPFLEQPWMRTGPGTAWDGLPKYDLTRYNPWYFDRLKAFAALCDRKGEILFHNFFMQHAFLEFQGHWVDSPWRPDNCLQATGMPEQIPVANVFYDLKNPELRQLQTAYIRKCLDVLGSYNNVIYLCSEEYTGPLSFMRFWLDTLTGWEREHHRHLLIAIGGTKDVLDALAGDDRVSVLDLSYWWYQPDGSLYAPPGGKQVAGRYAMGGNSARTTPQEIYRQVREYRTRYPQKGLIYRLNASRQQTWAFLMGGGSMILRFLPYPGHASSMPAWATNAPALARVLKAYAGHPSSAPAWASGGMPKHYIAPKATAIVQPTYDFIRANLATRLPKMVPMDIVRNGADHNWCLGQAGETYLVYALSGGSVSVDLSNVSGSFRATWFDPRTGKLQADATHGTVRGGKVVTFTAPGAEDWALWLQKAP